MPIVVNPGFVWPPETDPVVSPDGRITAIVDPAHAGVLLRADFSDQVDIEENRNWMTNPSLEYSGARWAAYSWPGTGERTKGSGAGGGQWFFRLTATADSTGSKGVYHDVDCPVQAGESWTASCYVRPSSAVVMVARGELRDSSGPIAASGGPGEATTCPAGEWTRVSITLTAGASAEKFRHQVYLNSATIPSGGTLDMDCEMVNQGELIPYFDGDAPDADSPETVNAWLGAAGGSVSASTTVQKYYVSQVRFERQDGTVVRSGNPAWAPGGYAHAYDHEATLGGGTLWRAVPIRFDGLEGVPSEFVGAVIPGLSDGWGWFKPVADPNKALLLRVEPPDLDYNGRVDTTSIAASRRPAATWDLLQGFSTQLRSLVRERSIEDQLMQLLDLGPVLAQFPTCAGIPDFFFIREKVTAEHVHWDGYPWRRYTIPVVSVDRPTTIDTPLRIPDLSYDTVERDWTTYDQLEATVDSYNDLLTSGDEKDPIVWDGGYPNDDTGIVIDGGQP